MPGLQLESFNNKAKGDGFLDKRVNIETLMNKKIPELLKVFGYEYMESSIIAQWPVRLSKDVKAVRTSSPWLDLKPWLLCYLICCCFLGPGHCGGQRLLCEVEAWSGGEGEDQCQRSGAYQLHLR